MVAAAGAVVAVVGVAWAGAAMHTKEDLLNLVLASSLRVSTLTCGEKGKKGDVK